MTQHHTTHHKKDDDQTAAEKKTAKRAESDPHGLVDLSPEERDARAKRDTEIAEAVKRGAPANVADDPAQSAALGIQPPAEYTKMFQVEIPRFGSLRVKADSADEAIDKFLGKHGLAHEKEKVAKDLICREIPFTPADTEKDKPGGWVKDKHVFQRAR